MMTAKKLAMVVFLLVPYLLALPQPAHAKAITVGDGTAASCTEAALRNALTFAEGEWRSDIRFNCGAEHLTITVTATLEIPDNTTIDGDGLITLDGQFVGVTILHVGPDSTASLQNLTIERGGCADFQGCTVLGGGIFNEGNLAIDGCTVTGNFTFGSSGGGVFNGGTLSVRDSIFAGNYSSRGAGIYNLGTLTVQDSAFSQDIAVAGGGIFDGSTSTLRIQNSTFTENVTGGGGGAAIWSAGVVILTGSKFLRNGILGEDRGSIVVHDTLIVHGSTFSANIAGVGGAISGGTVAVSDSTFSSNRAVHCGGGIEAGTLTVSGSTFSDNRSRAGGAICAVNVTIRDSTFEANHGGGFGGGALYIGNAPSFGGLGFGNGTISNSTITRNIAGVGGGIVNDRAALTIIETAITENYARMENLETGQGGGIWNRGTLTIKDSTVTSNVADVDGGGIFNFFGFTLDIKGDTVVANNVPNDIAP